MKKIILQTICCFFLVFIFMVANKSTVPQVKSGTQAVLNYMEVDYAKGDMKAVADKATEMLTTYGKPIDEEYDGNETLVYAVGGGKVTAVGENEEIGKYIKITHGNKAESLYGNLDTLKVEIMNNVKKGQIIGTYTKEDGRDFYYSFNEF